MILNRPRLSLRHHHSTSLFPFLSVCLSFFNHSSSHQPTLILYLTSPHSRLTLTAMTLLTPLRLLATTATLLLTPIHAQSATSALAGTASPALTASPTVTAASCPAAVSTTDICSTCVTAACVIEATITAACGCPNPPETIFSSHPCSLGCGGLGCATVYTVVTEPCTGGPGSGSLTGTAPPAGSTPPTAPNGGATGSIATGAGCRVQPFGQFRFW
ncbi:hypothetical protein B0T16DRAFT_416558 [Cercophora newfieldiana]|uniref:Uncharacterized protein n=1 Tax=Cercophora newfieldiana TaxID=92897 RepID=A0AA39Y0I6_9PEZI|nr:hypothetical protein B0T16DRAFT_416558 [Cercophora newfieldiana]